MRFKGILTIFACLTVMYSVNHSKTDEFSVLKGPYLGQKPPGKIPEIFAHGFGNGRYDIYWVDAKIIEEIEPKKIK